MDFESAQQMIQQNNAWSAQQAQKQMDFQREMSNTAHVREIADLKAAGLNPVLSAKLGGASTPNGAMGDTDTSGTTALIDMMASAVHAAGSGAAAANSAIEGLGDIVSNVIVGFTGTRKQQAEAWSNLGKFAIEKGWPLLNNVLDAFNNPNSHSAKENSVIQNNAESENSVIQNNAESEKNKEYSWEPDYIGNKNWNDMTDDEKKYQVYKQMYENHPWIFKTFYPKGYPWFMNARNYYQTVYSRGYRHGNSGSAKWNLMATK